MILFNLFYYKFYFKNNFSFFKFILIDFFFFNKNKYSYIYFFKNNFIIFWLINNSKYNYKYNYKNLINNLKLKLKKTLGQGYLIIKLFFLIFLIDASITDDEPLWEPLEWSLIQTWIFFIFMFAWIAENLITSRYGSFTGRDKRVWLGWYRTFWLIELCYIISYGLSSTFIIIPFYYELTYNIAFVFSWWHWYSRIFFFKFIFLFSIILFLSFLIQINLKWLNWKKLFFLIILINLFIGYLLYINFIMSFFSYFTDPLWYQKTRTIDYIQLSHEPLKWGWGTAKRDHYSYHKVSTVFWFKNDGPFAGSMLMLHFFFFLSIFFLLIYWLILFRKIYFSKEISYNFLTYCISSLKQFFFFFFFF